MIITFDPKDLAYHDSSLGQKSTLFFPQPTKIWYLLKKTVLEGFSDEFKQMV